MKIAAIVVYIIICLLLITLVLLQEGRSAGLGSIAGMADTYWGKAKGRSIEGKIEKFTTILAAVFLLASLGLNLIW